MGEAYGDYETAGEDSEQQPEDGSLTIVMGGLSNTINQLHEDAATVSMVGGKKRRKRKSKLKPSPESIEIWSELEKGSKEDHLERQLSEEDRLMSSSAPSLLSLSAKDDYLHFKKGEEKTWLSLWM